VCVSCGKVTDITLPPCQVPPLRQRSSAPFPGTRQTCSAWPGRVLPGPVADPAGQPGPARMHSNPPTRSGEGELHTHPPCHPRPIPDGKCQETRPQRRSKLRSHDLQGCRMFRCISDFAAGRPRRSP
jgi:hypothetical protein